MLKHTYRTWSSKSLCFPHFAGFSYVLRITILRTNYDDKKEHMLSLFPQLAFLSIAILGQLFVTGCWFSFFFTFSLPSYSLYLYYLSVYGLKKAELPKNCTLFCIILFSLLSDLILFVIHGNVNKHNTTLRLWVSLCSANSLIWGCHLVPKIITIQNKQFPYHAHTQEFSWV